jgi:enamine deaminase RidA (YjgF/YER057c/UK114 family)
MTQVEPDTWAKPIGYANGVLAPAGRLLFVAGQVGWNESQEFESSELAPQFAQALRNVLAVVHKAGGGPEQICRMTCFCTDKQAYLSARPELGQIWRELMGRHYPAMSMLFVSDLLDAPGQIEIEATAVLPDPS